MSVDLSRTVAELVVERPARARVFERLGLDDCCGGRRSLAEACTQKGIDPDAAAPALDAPRAPIAELCDRLVGSAA
jgi:regulator of cell morphogenesis and NO signaling